MPQSGGTSNTGYGYGYQLRWAFALLPAIWRNKYCYYTGPLQKLRVHAPPPPSSIYVMECDKETVAKLSNGTILNDRVTSNPDFKVTIFPTSITRQWYKTELYLVWQTSLRVSLYDLSNGTISSDLGWPLSYISGFQRQTLSRGLYATAELLVVWAGEQTPSAGLKPKFVREDLKM